MFDPFGFHRGGSRVRLIAWAGLVILQSAPMVRPAQAQDYILQFRRLDEQPPISQDIDESARTNRLVAKQALAAVVQIVTQANATSEQHPEIPEDVPEQWRRFFEEHAPPGGPRFGQGSGVIIDADQGTILTNNHVVGEASDIQVRLPDGRRYQGKLLGADPPTDLAVVRIEAESLHQLTIGDSDSLEVGDPVMTVGNPFGLEGTVSKGIVSAKDRSQLGIIDYEGFIQTDAVINPGNSGGPLINMRAEIVGINTAIETRTGTFSGVGFAIPSSRIKKVLPYLLRGEKIVRGYLGVQIGSVRDDQDRAKSLNWDDLNGVLVDDVFPESPAAEAGLKPGDIILSMNGTPLNSVGQLTDTVAFIPPGNRVIFDVWRNGHLVSLQAVVGRQPEGFSTRPRMHGDFAPPPDDRDEKKKSPEEFAELPQLGVEVEALNTAAREQFGLRQDVTHGVVITEVDSDGLAAEKNLQPGNVIVAVNGQSIHSVEELQELLRKVEKDRPIDLRIRDNKGSRHVQFQPVK